MTPPGRATDLPAPTVVRNEFALVEVGFVRRGDAVSLTLTDPASGSRVVLDATELEALAQASRESLRRLLADAAGGSDHMPRAEGALPDVAPEEGTTA